MTQLKSLIDTTEEYLYTTTSKPENQKLEQPLNISLDPNFSMPSHLTDKVPAPPKEKKKNHKRHKPYNPDPL